MCYSGYCSLEDNHSVLLGALRYVVFESLPIM